MAERWARYWDWGWNIWWRNIKPIFSLAQLTLLHYSMTTLNTFFLDLILQPRLALDWESSKVFCMWKDQGLNFLETLWTSPAHGLTWLINNQWLCLICLWGFYSSSLLLCLFLNVIQLNSFQMWFFHNWPSKKWAKTSNVCIKLTPLFKKGTDVGQPWGSSNTWVVIELGRISLPCDITKGGSCKTWTCLTSACCPTSASTQFERFSEKSALHREKIKEPQSCLFRAPNFPETSEGQEALGWSAHTDPAASPPLHTHTSATLNPPDSQAQRCSFCFFSN